MPLKGLKDIRTRLSLSAATDGPQHGYLKLAMLAMEKTRRSHERQGVQTRIEGIDKRLAEIDAETERLLGSVFPRDPPTHSRQPGRCVRSSRQTGSCFRTTRPWHAHLVLKEDGPC